MFQPYRRFHRPRAGGPILNGDDDGASDGPAHSWISPSFLLLGLHRQAKSRGPQIQEGAQGIPKEKARVKGQEQGAPDPRRGPVRHGGCNPKIRRGCSRGPQIQEGAQGIPGEPLCPINLILVFHVMRLMAVDAS